MAPSAGKFVTFHSESGDLVAMITGVAENPETHQVTADLTAFPRGGPPHAVTSVLQGEGLGCWSWPGKPPREKKAKAKKSKK
jgi:hypothetical protein